jgi:hypothetical protein
MYKGIQKRPTFAELYNGEVFNGHQKELDRVTATERNVNIKEKLEVC